VNNTVTVAHSTENFAGLPLGQPLYYNVAASLGYFFNNPRGVVFLKTIDTLDVGASTFQVSAVPSGDVLSLQSNLSGTFQIANQARTFAGNNVDPATQIVLDIVKADSFEFEGANDQAIGGNGISTVTSYSGSLVNVSTVAAAGLDYYQGAMLRYTTTGGAANGLVANATYFVDSFFSTGTDTFAFTLKALPNSESAISITGGTGTQSFTRIGVSLDKDIIHVRNSNFAQKDMIEYTFPVGGNFEADDEKLFYFVAEAYDSHNYLVNATSELFTPMVATGGTILPDYQSQGTTYRAHQFTNTGNSTFTVQTVGSEGLEYLIVAGGGSGGGNLAGGGGAGGVLTNLGATPIEVTAQDYLFTVGAGGSGVAATTSNSGTAGNNGQNSSAFGLTAIGGGYGGGGQNGVSPTSGGSGGGGGGYVATAGGAGTEGQGNAGGVGGTASQQYRAGGGGGASGIGGNWTNSNGRGGFGGDGRIVAIDGNNFAYGAGGGGGSYVDNSGGGNGGFGGGGGGGTNSASPGSGGTGGRNPGLNGVASNTSTNNSTPRGGNAGANTGSGGGGAGHQTALSGSGGSGIVIVRYPLTPLVEFVAADATGGTITTVTEGGTTYRVHTFTTVGTSNFSVNRTGSWNEFEYLIVAGGGSGGSSFGGGGGAGGFVEGQVELSAASYPIAVGAGAARSAAADSVRGSNGVNSSAFGINAIGGGGGGAYINAPLGIAGGSGGGGGSSENDAFHAGGAATQGSPGFGFDGGAGRGRGGYLGGGGGGAGGAGQQAITNSKAGDGGIGRASSITGSNTFYAGGGGGAAYNYQNGTQDGAASLGGGPRGRSESSSAPGFNAPVNTGAGGGGGGYPTGGGGAGGSGIVVIRYPIAVAT
jgi:hypothetical protein